MGEWVNSDFWVSKLDKKKHFILSSCLFRLFIGISCIIIFILSGYDGKVPIPFIIHHPAPQLSKYEHGHKKYPAAARPGKQVHALFTHHGGTGMSEGPARRFTAFFALLFSNPSMTCAGMPWSCGIPLETFRRSS